jgi:hypothetical protein
LKTNKTFIKEKTRNKKIRTKLEKKQYMINWNSITQSKTNKFFIKRSRIKIKKIKKH